MMGKENHASKYVVISKQSNACVSPKCNVTNAISTPTSYQINRYTCKTAAGKTIRVVPINNLSSDHSNSQSSKSVQTLRERIKTHSFLTAVQANSSSFAAYPRARNKPRVSACAKSKNTQVDCSNARQKCKGKKITTAVQQPPIQTSFSSCNDFSQSTIEFIGNKTSDKDIRCKEGDKVKEPVLTVSLSGSSQMSAILDPPLTTPFPAIEFKDYCKLYKICGLSLSISSGSKIAVVGSSSLKYFYKALSHPSKVGSVKVHGKAAGSGDIPNNSVLYIREQPEFESDVLIRLLGGEVTDLIEDCFLHVHYALMVTGLLQLWQLQIQSSYTNWVVIDVDALDDKDRQLLLMARAIYSDYKIIIIEQTVCSNKLFQQLMYNLIFGPIFQAKTVIFCPFYLDYATWFDKFLVFNSEGVLVEQGHANYLLKDQSCKLFAMEPNFPRIDPNEPRLSPIEDNMFSVLPNLNHDNIFEDPLTGELNFNLPEFDSI